jgi:hypothetical protein
MKKLTMFVAVALAMACIPFFPVIGLTPPDSEGPIQIQWIKMEVFDKAGHFVNQFIDDDKNDIFINASMGYIAPESKIKISWKTIGESPDFDHWYIRYGMGSDPGVLKDDTIIERNLKDPDNFYQWFVVPKKSGGWYFKIWISAKGPFKKITKPLNNDFADDLGGANTRPFYTKKDLYKPIVRNHDVTNITTDEAVLNGELLDPGNAPPTVVYFLLRKDGEQYDPLNRFGTLEKNDAGRFSFSAYNLEYDQVYYYIAISLNFAGVTSAGGYFEWERTNPISEIKFKTLPKPPIVVTLDIDKNKIVLDNPPHDPTKDGAIVSGYLKDTGYSVEELNAGVEVGFLVTTASKRHKEYIYEYKLYTPGNYSINIPIDFDDVYTVKAIARNTIAEAIGDPRTFKTPKRIVPPIVQTIDVRALTPYSAIFHGKLISMGNDPNGCQVRFEHNGGIDNLNSRPYGFKTQWMQMNELGDFYFPITLKPGSMEKPRKNCDGSFDCQPGFGGIYAYVATGRNSAGEYDDWDERVVFVVPPTPYPPKFALRSPTDIKATQVKVVGYVLDFGKDENYENNDDIFYARAIVYKKGDAKNKISSTWKAISKLEKQWGDRRFHFEVKNLEPDTFYVVTIEALNTANGSWIKPDGDDSIIIKTKSIDFDNTTIPTIMTTDQVSATDSTMTMGAEVISTGGYVWQRDDAGNIMYDDGTTGTTILDTKKTPLLRPLKARVVFQITDCPIKWLDNYTSYEDVQDLPRYNWIFAEIGNIENIEAGNTYEFTHTILQKNRQWSIRAVLINEMGISSPGIWKVYQTNQTP